MLYQGDTTTNKYADLSTLGNLVPLVPPSTIKPLATITAPGNQAVNFTAYDPNIRSPYIESINFAVARNVTSNIYAEVRYIGTLSRKQLAGVNLNTANWLHNGLKEAFDAARRGQNSTLGYSGTSPLLDQIFKGIQFSNLTNTLPVGAPGGPTGGDELRALAGSSLANGDYNAVANTLYQTNYTKSATLNTGLPSTTGAPTYGGVLRVNGFPENFIYANPQLGTATWDSNFNHQNYHSMQATLTIRPTRGLSTNLSYTFAKGLGDPGSWADPSNRSVDYTWTSNSRAQQLNMYGTLDLPFGANGLFFRNVTSPVLKRVMEGWQMSWILTLQSGQRSSLTDGVNQMIGGTATPNYVAQAGVFDPSNNGTYFPAGALHGSYFATNLVAVQDPSCTDETLVSKALGTTSNCTAQALALANPNGTVSNTIVYRQSLPGTNGNVGTNTFEGIGVFSLDMAMGKTVALTEGKSLNIRIDAQNILNHPTPSGAVTVWNARFTQITDPSFAYGNGVTNPLGYIQTKGQHRTFQGKIRIQF